MKTYLSKKKYMLSNIDLNCKKIKFLSYGNNCSKAYRANPKIY